MKRNWFARLSYISLFILFALLYRFFANYFLLLLMISMVLFVPFSIIALKYSSRHISISITCSYEGYGSYRYELFPSIYLENRSTLPIARASFNLDYRNEFFSQTDTNTFICGIPPEGKSVIDLQFGLWCCGAVTLEIGNVRMWDYTGMFDIEKKIQAKASVLILPQPLDIPADISAVGGAGLCELVDQDAKGNDSSQVIDTREYIPGDKPNRIHWKLSSKLDRLIVKEYGSVSSNDLIVVMELFYLPYESTNPPKAERNYAMLAACFTIYVTLMNQLMDEKRPFILYYYSPSAQELKSETISSIEEGMAALELLFYTKTSSFNPAMVMARTLIDEYGDFIYIRPQCPQCALSSDEEVLIGVYNEELGTLARAVHVRQ